MNITNSEPSIPAINDLKRLDPELKTRIKSKINEVIDSGWYVLGKEVNEFERKFANYCGVAHCVSVANGTEALELSLKALKLSNGKKIATVANAGMYSTLAILSVGSVPVYIDIDPDTHTMSQESLRNVLVQGDIAGIIITHIYGQLANIESIIEISKSFNIATIEDCAQSHGAQIPKGKAGSFADIGTFSFYPTKNLGAFGDGGALVTNNPELASDLKKYRQYGWDTKYHVVKKDCRNSRLDEMQAAVLNLKLEYLDEWNEKRRSIVRRIKSACGHISSIQFPPFVDDSYVAHLFVIVCNDRDKLASFLKGKNIPTEVHYPIPDYKQAIFDEVTRDNFLPHTEMSCNNILTLPCFPEMTSFEVQFLANCLLEFEKCYHS